MLVHLPDGYTPEKVHDAFAEKVKTLDQARGEVGRAGLAVERPDQQLAHRGAGQPAARDVPEVAS